MNRIFILALVLSLTGFSETVGNKKAAPTASTPTQVKASQETVEVGAAPIGQIFIGPGLLLVGPYMGFGANASFGFKVNETSYSASYLGFDVGYYSIGGASIIPILFSSAYRFNIGTSIVHPRIGLGVGVGMVSAGGGSSNQETTTSGGSPQTALLLVFKPGVDFDVAKNITISLEPKFGLLTSILFFAPSLNVGFSF
jgi:hypothetical protein